MLRKMCMSDHKYIVSLNKDNLADGKAVTILHLMLLCNAEFSEKMFIGDFLSFSPKGGTI